MKKHLVMILMFVFIAFANVKGIVQTEAEAALQNGNSLYQKGDYQAALNSYESVLDLGYESASLYYNLGNSYFRINAIGKAIVNYEKALKLEPGDDDITYNLRIAQARNVDKIQSVPKLFISEWFDVLVALFPVSGWVIVLLIFYVFLILFIGIYFLARSGRIQRIAFYIGSVNLVVLTIVLILFISSYNRETNSNYGILIEEIITVKQSPNDQSSDAFVIHEGVKFEIEETLNNWAKIKLADGKVGWIQNTVFEGI